jgi:hypothetical protein
MFTSASPITGMLRTGASLCYNSGEIRNLTLW